MRTKTDLNGVWDFCPIYDVECDLSLYKCKKYEKISVPSNWRTNALYYKDFKPFDIMGYPEKWSEALTGVFRKDITIKKAEDERVFLIIENVGQMAAIYLNGQHIVDWDEMYLPLRHDITDYLKNGKNRLEIVCTSFESSAVPDGSQKSTGLKGSWYGDIVRGIWGNIYLEAVNAVHLTDITVRTSVREKTLTLLTEASVEDPDLTVSATVVDKESTVIELEGSVGEIETLWENPVYWDCENPHLYYITVRLNKGGKTVDQQTVRFGFREFWNEGTQFYLNGRMINLRGDSWHFQGALQMTKQYALNWYSLCKENGVNYVRLHAEPHPTYYLDAADESGMLVVDETAIYGSGKSMDASNEKYIERCEAHCERLVKRDKNHPCIIFWSLQNEMRWVDGRDIYKLRIPGMMKRMNILDPTRKVSVDGDNRLISYEDTQLESLHYNIDGTLKQWRREKPLTVGEHGGMWYICPQNASAYNGLKVYDNFEPCAIGFAKKERLFLEDARRKGVSGISTFNYAHYFTRSMPDEDVYVEGAPFKKIPKYSLTINNGYLKDYPLYRENPVMPFMRECFRPVTVIGREYNTRFYDQSVVKRSFDVYNDTLSDVRTTVDYTLLCKQNVIKSGKEQFDQKAGEHTVRFLELDFCKVETKTEFTLRIKLLHGNTLMYETEYNYVVYPSEIKRKKISVRRKAAYYGNDVCYKRIKALLTECVKLESISDALEYEMLILGNSLEDSSSDLQKELSDFVFWGGVLIVLEQTDFVLGDLHLQKQDFFSTYSKSYSHPILSGMSDDDFIFWRPTITEERPEPIIHQNFLKPQTGEYTFVLESSAGDYADGGDLWSPLMTVRHGKGTAIFCQLEINENFESVPQACVLLRNIIDYGGNLASNSYKTLAAIGDTAEKFMKNVNVEFERCDVDLSKADIAVADINEIDFDTAERFVKSGGTLVTLPFDRKGADFLSRLLSDEVVSEGCEISHIRPATSDACISDISPVDLYRYDKVPMSPRQVENRRIAVNSVESKHSEALMVSVPNTPWEDYYWHSNCSEYCRIALISMNREAEQKPICVMARQRFGNGTVIMSQISANGSDEKDIRIYTRILENLGAKTKTKLFSYERSVYDSAIDSFMTLPVQPWQDYEAAKEYYTDSRFSLNNLGEGLYGWMLKVEKNRSDGYITVPNSQRKKFFLTCFADKTEADEVAVALLDCNADADLYINGEKQNSEKVVLKTGINRVVIEADNNQDCNLKFRLVFLDQNGVPLNDIRSHLTIDEVDPK